MSPDNKDSKSNLPQAVTEGKVTMTYAQQHFFASEQCATARKALQQLVDNPAYNTDSSYFKNSDLEFVDRHLYYLSTHPGVNLQGYISNLKIMTGAKSHRK